MSPVSQLSLLALASTVLASPYAGAGHAHAHNHKRLHTGSAAPYAYGSANSTGIYGSSGIPCTTSSTAANVPVGGPQTLTSTITHDNSHVETVVKTVQQPEASSYVAANHAAASYGAASYGSAGNGAASSVAAQSTAAISESQCAPDVTVTSTEKVYVTVTAGEYGSSSAAVSAVESSHAAGSSAYQAKSSAAAPGPYSSSSWAAPVSSASKPAYSAPAYTPSSEAAPVVTSSSSSSVLSIPSISSVYSAADKGVENAATQVASSTAPSYSASAPSGGKRGLAYNDASLCSSFDGSSEVSWAYNWVSSSSGLTGWSYIPTLHSSSSDFTGSWSSDAQSAIDSGSKTLFSFNEPDISSQANMAASAAAAAYVQYMNPFKGSASLCAPAVSNGPADQGMGLGWLSSFLDACKTGSEACQIDCLNIHWYGTEVDDLKNQTQQAIDMAGGKPVWVSEFAPTGLDDAGINSFLQEIMPWFDSNPNVAGYAYYMVADGKLLSGDQPSTYGSTYKSYTS